MFAFLTGRPMAAVNRGVRTDAKAGAPRRVSMLLAGIALGFSAPVHAADNASVSRVQLLIDRQCTAASPTVFGTTVAYTGTVDDLPGNANVGDIVQIYHLDGNNSVVARNSGYAGSLNAQVGVQSGANAATLMIATPATHPYTAVLWDATTDTFAFNAGDTLDVNAPEVLATMSFDMNALDADCPGGPAADTTPPQLASIERSTPADEFTSYDFLVWRVTFDEDVQGLDTNDFAISGTTASIDTVTAGSGASEYSVRARGGDLATLDGVVSLSISGSATIEDTAGNSLTNTAATGATETYTLDNTAPTVTFTNGTPDPATGAFQLTATLSEAVDQFSTDGITVGNGTLSNIVAVSGTVYTATVTPTTRTLVTIDMPFGWAVDLAGNINSAATQLVVDVSIDTTPPTVALTSSATSPTNAPFTVTATFSEDVTGFDASDLQVTNGAASNTQMASASVYTATVTPAADGDVVITVPAGAAQDGTSNASLAATPVTIVFDATAPTVAIAANVGPTVGGPFEATFTFSESVTGFAEGDITVGNGTASNVNGVSQSVYTATITPAADGQVTIDVAAQAAFDLAGNFSTAAAQFTITKVSDAIPPDVVLSTSATDPVSGAFAITATFSEDVTGFELADLVVGNGVASNFSAVSASVYTADITPTTDGAVTVDVATGAANDGAGNPSTAAAQFSISSDATPPGLAISLPGATVEGTFTATFTFSEGVTGFELSDITVTNGAASALTPGATGVYTATITPETVGALTVSVAEGAAQDSAGNGSAADSASVEVVFPAVDVDLDLGSTVLDPNSVTTTVTLSNPGSLAVDFVASVDVPWADVTPSSGTIPASGSIQFTVGLNAEADGLDPGDYSGTVTVTTAAPAGQAAQASRGPASAGSTVLANIPVTASIAARFGSLQVVATTPGGTHGDETFTYASSDADLGGLSLTTSGGAASSAPIQKIFGTYDLAQSLPQGWALESLTCAGDTDGGSVIDLAAGSVDIDLDPSETIVCTFANTRDADAVRLATLRAINNYMVRRADRILTGAPDLSTRLRDRTATTPGRFSADVDGANVTMNFAGSLSGLRNHAKANERQVPDGPQLAESGAARFDAWFSASYDALDDDRAGDQADSRFGLFQLGADWLVADNALVGIMVQIDQMSETADNPVEAAGAVSGAEIDGTGWMAGPYAVWEFAPGTTLDVLAMWGRSENTINPLGFYEDEFETTRYMIRANLTGEWSAPRSDAGQLKVRPGISWAHYEETQDGYTDSLAIAIPEQTISVGRLEAGPEIAYRMDGQRPGSWWEPTAAVRAVWDYDGADLMDETGRSIDDGQLRADASLGLRGQWANGAHVSAQARFSGLGNNDFSANGVRVELRMPF
ncbi:Ig-like domain-containing protein [Maricaulis maris]|nr:Ig-like domain-containing protein [Maricaulis maris]